MERVVFPITKKGMRSILQGFDRDHDGRVDYEEFLRSESGDGSPADGCASEDSVLRDAFCVFDKDGDGFISPEELKTTLAQLGLMSPCSSLSSVRSMIRRFDMDGDGHVSFAEFQAMIASGGF
ncbi:hypothetical protein KP509_11G089200 [Ceratopteris richardii]|uniref:EF-hand domain-containing protein n=1 Tax=Ceratopteris richardii TaxID=49495 RepID=A0A8T2TX82_CERRI|nr:hypothetical protein KP509_11G089200 [Ceratopteris richardii]